MAMDNFQLVGIKREQQDDDRKSSLNIIKILVSHHHHHHDNQHDIGDSCEGECGRICSEREIRQPLNLPVIDENLEHMTSLMDQRGSNTESAFLHHTDSFTKRLYKNGFRSTLWELLESYCERNSGDNGDWVKKACSWAALVADRISTLLKVSSSTQLSPLEAMSQYSQTHNWKNSVVKAIAWHPHVLKLAIGYSDHSVRLYSQISPVTPLLKHKSQRNITCIAWQKFASSTLAVGCEHGIVIWQVDPQLLSARPSGSAVQVLAHPGAHPVTSLSWSPDGLLLLSSSALDSNVLVWDIAQERYERFDRKHGYGNVKASWSPDGSRVMCTTQTNIVRLWNTHTWECEKWSSESQGRWLACSWSSDGSVLLFSGEASAIVYALCFSVQGQGHSTGTAKQVVDLMKSLPEHLANRFDGWYIRDIVWDKKATNLVLLITAGDGALSHLLFFRSRLGLTLEVSYSGILEGTIDKYVTTMAFCIQDNQSVLTVAWLGGEISHIPLDTLDASVVAAPSSDRTTRLFSTTLS